MRTRNKLFVLLVTIVMVVALVLVGCGSKPPVVDKQPDGDGIPTAGDNEGIGSNTIAFVCIDMQGAFWVEMMNGGEIAAKDYDVDLVFKSGEGSLEKQINLIENLITQGVGCIIVDPLDKKGILPAVNAATEAGIPVITCGNEIEGIANISCIYNDSYDVGSITDIICKEIGENGKVACVVGAPGSAVSDARQKGFEDAIAKYPDVEGFVLPAKWDATIAQQMVSDLLVAEPDLSAVVCADAVGFQVWQAVDAADKTDQVIIGNYTAMKENIPGVKDGTYMMDLLMGGVRVGYWNVATAAQLMQGTEIPRLIYLPTSIVMNEDNIAKAETWGIDNVYCTPDEALQILESSTAEFGPDGYNVENYLPK